MLRRRLLWSRSIELRVLRPNSGIRRASSVDVYVSKFHFEWNRLSFQCEWTVDVHISDTLCLLLLFFPPFFRAIRPCLSVLVSMSTYVRETQRLTIFQSLKTFLSAPPKQIYAQVDRRKENCNEKAPVKRVFAFRFLSSFFNVAVWKSIIYLSCISSNANITWRILMHPKIRIFSHSIKFKDHV